MADQPNPLFVETFAQKEEVVHCMLPYHGGDEFSLNMINQFASAFEEGFFEKFSKRLQERRIRCPALLTEIYFAKPPACTYEEALMDVINWLRLTQGEVEGRQFTLDEMEKIASDAQNCKDKDNTRPRECAMLLRFEVTRRLQLIVQADLDAWGNNFSRHLNTAVRRMMHLAARRVMRVENIERSQAERREWNAKMQTVDFRRVFSMYFLYYHMWEYGVGGLVLNNIQVFNDGTTEFKNDVDAWKKGIADNKPTTTQYMHLALIYEMHLMRVLGIKCTTMKDANPTLF